jgi:hypothetical protein
VTYIVVKAFCVNLYWPEDILFTTNYKLVAKLALIYYTVKYAGYYNIKLTVNITGIGDYFHDNEIV